ncbi:MAG: maleylacetoacetate isomerase [Xanthomonadaceae bacterium]|nr:maleylacetoacetate isomerase [Xanthomonadaceae bacterium]
MTTKLKLYHYWRSSSSWRVRWALTLKNIPHELVAVSLLDGESESAAHRARNPLGYVPVLEISKGEYLFESLAIIQYLEDKYPNPSLLWRSTDSLTRAKIWQLAEIINASTQPLQNLTPQEMYSDDTEKRKSWAKHWNEVGLNAYEVICKETAGEFSVGDELTLADLCLIPQVYNSKRFDVDLSKYPTISRIYERAMREPSCIASEPSQFEPKK